MATINMQVQCPVLLWVWLQFELCVMIPEVQCMLLMPPPLSQKEGMRRLANTVEMDSLDMEMMK